MRRRGFLHAQSAFLGFALFGKALRALAEWNAKAFDATTEAEALAKFFGGRPIEPSAEINVDVLDLVEDGAFVPVQVTTTLPRPRSITLLAAKNPHPLIAHFELGSRCGAAIATRIKVAEPADIIGVVESGDRLYSARRFVKVIAGGCG
ncbi:MAG: thiosulfate oxidation carrier protein SoxY [Gammaproteobacteria bacterium]|nr:thiosulfate oxidation carrier protein SoxY [Gammaproteobacteria bacterium]